MPATQVLMGSSDASKRRDQSAGIGAASAQYVPATDRIWVVFIATCVGAGAGGRSCQAEAGGRGDRHLAPLEFRAACRCASLPPVCLRGCARAHAISLVRSQSTQLHQLHMRGHARVL